MEYWCRKYSHRHTLNQGLASATTYIRICKHFDRLIAMLEIRASVAQWQFDCLTRNLLFSVLWFRLIGTGPFFPLPFSVAVSSSTDADRQVKSWSLPDLSVSLIPPRGGDFGKVLASWAVWHVVGDAALTDLLHRLRIDEPAVDYKELPLDGRTLTAVNPYPPSESSLYFYTK